MKRATSRKAKPGHLIAFHGRLTGDSSPDIVFAWGEGCSKRDGAFLHMSLASPTPPAVRGRDWEPSFLEGLTARGYDITTLQFSIKKLQVEGADE